MFGVKQMFGPKKQINTGEEMKEMSTHAATGKAIRQDLKKFFPEQNQMASKFGAIYLLSLPVHTKGKLTQRKH